MNESLNLTPDFASSRGKFPGQWIINGRAEDVLCSIFWAGCSFSVQDNDEREQPWAHHRTMWLYPLDRGMIVSHDANALRGGSFFEIDGTRAGMFLEGRSAPYGEGEFVSRPIRRFRVQTVYRESSIGVQITAHADAAPEDLGKVDAWLLVVNFSIPRADFQTFFALNDLGTRTFNEVYDRHVVS